MVKPERCQDPKPHRPHEWFCLTAVPPTRRGDWMDMTAEPAGCPGKPGNPLYADQPKHPLYLAPHAALIVARSVLGDTVDAQVMDRDQADAIADAVVLALMPLVQHWD